MPKRKRPVLGRDYIIDSDGKAEFTAEYLAKRGYCCEHDCRYCPFLTTQSSSNQQQTHVSCTGSVSSLVQLR